MCGVCLMCGFMCVVCPCACLFCLHVYIIVYVCVCVVFLCVFLGNYGVPDDKKDEFGLPKNFEGKEIHVSPLVP